MKIKQLAYLYFLSGVVFIVLAAAIYNTGFNGFVTPVTTISITMFAFGWFFLKQTKYGGRKTTAHKVRA